MKTMRLFSSNYLFCVLITSIITLGLSSCRGTKTTSIDGKKQDGVVTKEVILPCQDEQKKYENDYIFLVSTSVVGKSKDTAKRFTMTSINGLLANLIKVEVELFTQDKAQRNNHTISSEDQTITDRIVTYTTNIVSNKKILCEKMYENNNKGIIEYECFILAGIKTTDIINSYSDAAQIEKDKTHEFEKWRFEKDKEKEAEEFKSFLERRKERSANLND